MADARLNRITVQALPSILTPQQPQKPPLRAINQPLNTQPPSTAAHTAAPPPEKAVVKRKRGRPPRNPGTSGGGGGGAVVTSIANDVNKRSKTEKEDEDVCFICFDGGNLVVCDRRDCPKAYHPSCVKREESFFRPNLLWNCGWHLCNFCQRNALFMCYTCPYSLCKKCVKQADIVRIRGNKGFCRICIQTIMLIENIPLETKEQVQVDFDDTSSWEYLFKVYWIYLKEKESLTLDELSRASSPLRGFVNDFSLQKPAETCISNVTELSSNIVQLETDAIKRRKTRKQQQLPSLESQFADKPVEDKVSSSHAAVDWASKELLEFVSHMKNGEMSVLLQFDVQSLLLDYIRKNNLRDPRRKCQIICDKRLQNLFGKERVGHFEMLKLLEYHFKEESRTSGVVRSAAVGPLSGPLENEESCGDIPISSRETRRQTRRKAEEKDRQTKMNSYAAIDVHNISLIYLKRSLLENLMVDATNFHDKVVGSVVRIRISSNDKRQDMHRLVRIIGTSKATKTDKVDDKAEGFLFQIVNLNKIEDITITAISDQEFSEDECKRLRQSIKLGLAERMTVGEIQEKAIALQMVRVDDSLETELRKLNHLKDRASEMGHRKELRECVEKIELLKSPEERERRIHEIPDVHADPRMDPSYGSDDDSGSDIKKQDGRVMSKHKNSIAQGVELISPVRAGNMLKDDRTKVLKTSVANGERKRKNSTRLHVGKVEVSERPLEPCNIEREASKTLEHNNRVALQVVAGDGDTTGSTSQAASDFSGLTALPSRMLLVSDIRELEKIWHYQDPTGKVQGPFCMLQLRNWDSNGFFPSELRVWKTDENPGQSILLTDALKKHQSNEPEPHVERQSDCGGESDDKKVYSLEEVSSNTDASSLNHKPNERRNNNSLSDITATSEVNDLPTNGLSSLLLSDDQHSIGQSELDMKARLIESLFDTEEPSSIATPTGSSETMQVTHNSESSHPSTSTSKSDNVYFESDLVESQPSSPNTGQDTGDGLVLTSNGAKAPDLPSSTPNSNTEDLNGHSLQNNHVTSCISEDLDARTRSSATLFSHSPSLAQKMDNKEVDHDTVEKYATSAVHDQDSGMEGTVSGGIVASNIASVAKNVETEGLKPHAVEKRHSIPSDVPRQGSEVIWSSISDGPNASLLPSNKSNMEATKSHVLDNKHYNSASSAPEQDSATNWSTISDGIVFSDLPSTSLELESNSLETPAVENKDIKGPNVLGHSGSNWMSMTERLGFSDLSTSSLKLDETSRGQVMENKNSAILNVHGQDSCISWRTASNLADGEVHLPDVTGEWGSYSTVHEKRVDDFNAALVSGSSDNLGEVTGDGATTTSHGCQMTTLNCDTSWQFIELSVLGDESVSDLLSEVEAMESLRGTSSPTFRMNSGDVSIDSPGDNCFSPLGGLSPNLDPVKNGALSSAADMHFHINLNISTGIPELEEIKPAIASMPHHNFVSEAPVSDVLPSPSPLPPPPQASIPPPAASVPPPLPPVSVPQSPPPSLPPPEKNLSSPSSTSNLDRPSSRHKEGEVDPTLLASHQRTMGIHHQPSTHSARMKVAVAHSLKQGSENISTDPPRHPSSKFPGTSSILGTPNLHWSTSGPGISVARVNPHRSTSVKSQGSKGPNQTSPRFSSHNNMGRHSGTKDRSHHPHVVDSGFSKNRLASWSKQSSIGGGSARPSSRGQRVCKFYESGYCKNGASCKYLHP